MKLLYYIVLTLFLSSAVVVVVSLDRDMSPVVICVPGLCLVFALIYIYKLNK